MPGRAAWAAQRPAQHVSPLGSLAGRTQTPSPRSLQAEIWINTFFLPFPTPPSSSLKLSHRLLADAMHKEKLAVLDLLFRASIK